MERKGLIHSKETFGTVDGPGVRYVLFMQGCTMRCKYCHNPDTWHLGAGTEVDAEQIISEYMKNEAFYTRGGITVTGGEPLLQPEFVAHLFSLAKERGIHTCLDTSGIAYDKSKPEICEKIDSVLDSTSLVMLDIKHIDDASHKHLTGHSNKPVLDFATHLAARSIPVWIRHVVVRGLTDAEEDLYRLGEFIGGLGNLRALDVLPYHNLGEMKYDALGIKYALSGLEPTSSAEAIRAKEHILRGIASARANSGR